MSAIIISPLLRLASLSVRLLWANCMTSQSLRRRLHFGLRASWPRKACLAPADIRAFFSRAFVKALATDFAFIRMVEFHPYFAPFFVRRVPSIRFHSVVHYSFLYFSRRLAFPGAIIDPLS